MPATIETEVGGRCATRFRSWRSAANPGRRGAAGLAPGAVLRSGLRLRHNAALPPAAGPPDRRRGAGDALPVAGGVVGVGLHDLGHQLVRPGPVTGAPDAG